MFKLWKKQRLVTKLALMILVIIMISIIPLYLITRQSNKEAVLESESTQLLNIAQFVSKDERVTAALAVEQATKPVQTYAQQVQADFNLDYVVIITENSIRLTHPDQSLIYQPFTGGDELDVLAGAQYVSTAVGSLGTSLRAFVPVYQNDQVIGAVAAGMTNQSLANLNRRSNQQITLGLIISMVIGIGFTTLAAVSIKRQLFNMEPEEIARRFEERQAMFDYTSDSIIVTNQHNDISLANSEANHHFNMTHTDLNQTKITSLLPDIDQVIGHDKLGKADNVYRYQDKDYIVSNAPILVNNELVGHIYIIRDATEMYSLLDQLYSTAEYTQSLQVQSHEFLNRLHVIYGLADLEEYAALTTYLDELISKESELTQRISVLVHDPVVAGQLIGEQRQLAQNLVAVSFDILNEIPHYNQPQIKQLWINTIQSLHKELIQNQPDLSLHMSLEYEGTQLLSHYYLYGETRDLQTWIETNQWHLPITLDEQDDHLYLMISTTYKENLDGI